MKITKFVHACLLVETPGRTAIFDPGMMSVGSLNPDNLTSLNNIIITHEHGDHFSLDLVKQLIAKFPDVQITAPTEVVTALDKEGIKATDQPTDGIVFFDAPHEKVTPLFNHPEEIGVHYLNQLTHPGDSHTFNETKAILALPVSGPWGSTVKAINLALELKPKHVLPIHDWHWHDQAKQQMYNGFEQAFAIEGIIFHKLKDGEAVDIEV